MLPSNGYKYTKAHFIESIRPVHGDKYDYSKTIYVNMKTPITIICPTHGAFTQSPKVHKKGCGCTPCGRKTQGGDHGLNTTEQFIAKSIKVHGDRYDYSLTKYTHTKDMVTIICPDHGPYTTLATYHLHQNTGCPVCHKPRTMNSKAEIEWLDSLNIDGLLVNKYIYLNDGSYLRPDGYDPVTNTIYEFHGDYWHGNPLRFSPTDYHEQLNKTFGELYEDTNNKMQRYRDSGYNVIEMWESDWATKATR